MPAYEDVYYYLWRERRLPPNVDVLDSRLDDEIGAGAAGARVRRRAWARSPATCCRCARARRGGTGAVAWESGALVAARRASCS